VLAGLDVLISGRLGLEDRGLGLVTSLLITLRMFSSLV